MNRVVHLSTAHSSSEVRLFVKECRSLAHAGYDVTVVLPHERDEIIDGVKIKGIPRTSSRLKRMTITAARVYREAVQLEADLYHLHMVELVPVGLLLWSKGKKVVYDIYEDAPRDLVTRDYLPSFAKPVVCWLVEQLENWAARCFSALVAATPTIGARFQPLNPRTVVVNNYPLRDELFPTEEVPWARRSSSVAYVGGIAPERGLFQMVEAMAYLPSTRRRKSLGSLRGQRSAGVCPIERLGHCAVEVLDELQNALP